MSFLRQLDTSHKLYACFAIMACLSAGLMLWLLGQLGSLAQSSVASVRAWTWFFIAASAALAGTLAVWLRAEMARPLQQASEIARRVAQGDLSTHLEHTGSGDGGALLLSMQEMNDRLAGMIVKLRGGTESIAGSAGECAAANLEWTARTEEHSAALQQTGAAMASLSATVKHSAGRAQQASNRTGSASAVAAQGAELVAQAVGSLAAVNDFSRRIAELIGVIDTLALQTNMLAVNAAVEATRAGDQGHGLAVAAAEVRTLAQRSVSAAHDIKLLIDASVDQIGAGAELLARASATMHDVRASVQQVSDIIGDIDVANAAQGAAIEQVSLAIAATTKASRHNAALVERSAGAATSMRDQAGRLSRASAAFSLGKNYAVPPPAIHLASSNPNKLVRIAPERRVRTAHMRAVVSATALQSATPAPGPAAPLRRGGSAARRDLEWEEF